MICSRKLSVRGLTAEWSRIGQPALYGCCWFLLAVTKEDLKILYHFPVSEKEVSFNWNGFFFLLLPGLNSFLLSLQPVLTLVLFSTSHCPSPFHTPLQVTALQASETYPSKSQCHWFRLPVFHLPVGFFFCPCFLIPLCFSGSLSLYADGIDAWETI